MDDAVYLLILHEFVESVEVANVHLHELIVGLILDVLQVCEVSGIGQLVEIDDVILGIFVDEKPYNMTADESGSASYDDVKFHCYSVKVNGLS